jgi:hypothetical protein
MQLRETEEESRAFVKHAVFKLGIAKKTQEIDSLGARLKRGELSREEQVQHAKMISDVKRLERQLQVDSREPSK